MFELATGSTPDKFQFFLPLVKADEEKHLLYARAAAEEPDKSGEIMDYATAVPAFQTWSRQYSEATMGKSFGNVRAMHNPRHLAGKVEKLDFDDEGKFVGAMIKVLDPVDWLKVEQGGYTGISIGGGYAKKWADPLNKNLTRYTPRIQEISLVDSPCIPSALIMELQKRDGTVTEIVLHGTPRSFNELLPPPTFGQMQKSLLGAAIGAGVGHYVGRRAGIVAGLARGAQDQERFAHHVLTGQRVGRVAGTVAGAGIGALVTRRRRDGSLKKPVTKQELMDRLTKDLGEITKAESPEAREKIRQTLHEFKHGKLRSFRADAKSKSDMPKVRDRKQAIAIALSQARRIGKSEDVAFVAALADRLEKRMPEMAAATPLSDKEHAQRIIAAKARWAKEGHPSVDDHHEALMTAARKAFLGRAGKIQAAQDHHDRFWHGVADTQGAYDKVRKELPKSSKLMMSLPGSGLLYNPEGIGEKHFDDRGRPKMPIYQLDHHEADDWIRRHGKSAGRVSKETPPGLIEHIDEIEGEAMAAAA